MEQKTIDLKEVEIVGKENPANRIILQVIANRNTNNPEKVSSFRYKSYNKQAYRILLADSISTESGDTIERKSKLPTDQLMVMESTTERKFIAPDISEEVILGTKISGFSKAEFGPIATAFQPFAFYDNLIPLLGKNYLNPISKGSLSKYWFQIEDTILNASDTTFLISFHKRNGKNFDALSGVLYINTNNFAIQNVLAEPADVGLMHIRIQQQYEFIDNKQWFPVQLNFELDIPDYMSGGVGVYIESRCYIHEIDLFPELRKSNFGIDAMFVDADAPKRNSDYWTQHRIEPLNEVDSITYCLMDSIGEVHDLDRMMDYYKIALNLKIPVSVFNIDLKESLVNNGYEGMRLGLALETNDKLIQNVSLGGFAGYGLKDQAWKYGMKLDFELNKRNEVEASVFYRNTVAEPGRTGIYQFNTGYYDIRDYFISQMNQQIQQGLSLGFRAMKYGQFRISFNNSVNTPSSLTTTEGFVRSFGERYTSSDISIQMRYAYGEKLSRLFDERIITETPYPVVSFCYSKGLKGLLGSEYDYNRFAIRLEDSFVTRRMGTTRLRIDAGLVDRPVPYQLLFTGEGTFTKNNFFIIKNSFQTMGMYEFLSDRYVSLFFSQDFGPLLFRTEKFRPHVVYHQNVGYGSLSKPENYSYVDFKTKEKGFFESGLQLDNIIRINYFKTFYLGLGVGVYYRYGAYSFANEFDNFAFKISLDASIN
ncbi:MAG: hypothetical protein JEZ03_06335 [Bacteroidales bacterium]|nr:hypothetical protein [Bacteroidales bacterium]